MYCVLYSTAAVANATDLEIGCKALRSDDDEPSVKNYQSSATSHPSSAITWLTINNEYHTTV